IKKYCVILTNRSCLRVLGQRIICGQEVIPYSIKYQASIQSNKYHQHGGTLIHPQWVVSAAHYVACINQWLRATSSTVSSTDRLGIWLISTTSWLSLRTFYGLAIEATNSTTRYLMIPS
uniref:Peptidase S1 domain-containing protein n=1 Tax=Hucho hucho TaxID=62062 RepID=A0A4W5PP41_9TELE